MQVTEDEIEIFNGQKKRKKNACTSLKLIAQAAYKLAYDRKDKREKREISIPVAILDNQVLERLYYLKWLTEK